MKHIGQMHDATLPHEFAIHVEPFPVIPLHMHQSRHRAGTLHHQEAQWIILPTSCQESSSFLARPMSSSVTGTGTPLIEWVALPSALTVR